MNSSISSYIDRIRNSILGRLTALLVVSLLLVSAVAFLTSYLIAIDHAKSDLKEKAEHNFENLKDILKLPLWNFANREVKFIGETYMKDPLTFAIEIVDGDKGVVFSAQNSDNELLYSLESVVTYRNSDVGYIRYSISNAQLKHLQDNLLISYETQVVSVLLAFLIFVIFVLRKDLARSFAFFISNVEKFGAGDVDAFKDKVVYKEFVPLQAALIDLENERARAEYSHMQAIEETARIFDLSVDMIGKGNLQGYFTKVNSAFQRTLGYSDEEIMSKPFLEFVFKDDYAETEEALKAASSGSELLNVINRYHCKDGSLKWIEWKVQVNVKENAFYATGRDIDQRKADEEELEAYRHRLECLVDERTKQLRETQEELVRRERLATMGKLTATVSHELRNPLGAMKPSLFLLRSRLGSEDEKNLKAIDTIDRNIARCDRIIDELLDYTRINALDKSPVEFDGWVASVVNEQLLPDSLVLRCEFGLDGVRLNIDRERFRRVIINMIENAVHAIGESQESGGMTQGGELRIKTFKKNSRFEIVVSDNGIGIPQDIISKVFEPLFSTKGFGIGLGMPTVKRIIEQHGGGISVESEEGVGTSFTVWLPESCYVTVN